MTHIRIEGAAKLGTVITLKSKSEQGEKTSWYKDTSGTSKWYWRQWLRGRGHINNGVYFYVLNGDQQLGCSAWDLYYLPSLLLTPIPTSGSESTKASLPPLSLTSNTQGITFRACSQTH